MIGLVIVLLAFIGLSAVLTSPSARQTLPGVAGVISASSALGVPGAPPLGAHTAHMQLDILLARLDEAWRLGDWARSVETLSEIVSLDPGNAAMRSRLYQAHVNLGWQLLVGHSLEAASSQFSLALQIRPDGEEAVEGLRLLQQLVLTAGGPVPPPAPVPTVAAPAPTVSALPVVCPPVAQPTVICPLTTVVAPACPTVTDGFVCYAVRTGDTLFGLARRFNTTVEAIIAANKLSTCTIFVCQKLLIPVGMCASAAPAVVCPAPTVCPPVTAAVVCPPPSICAAVAPAVACAAAPVVVCPPVRVLVHVVRRGEDIFHLAIRYRVSVALLMRANGLATTTVKVGQVLLIP
jgi:LysM repeat protein